MSECRISRNEVLIEVAKWHIGFANHFRKAGNEQRRQWHEQSADFFLSLQTPSANKE